MADSKNMEIKDEAMAKAAGGSDQIPGPKYDVGAQVELKLTNKEGIAVTVPGFIDERKAGATGWEYLVRYELDQETVERWFAEAAI
ncbi:MAG: hypothetical protein K6C41_05780 [Lachnospiraceae bacterium]|nr:hypothetical protein [Lachnospiraceae bacterium]